MPTDIACRAGGALDFAFTMAFQPILESADGSAWAYEALVRGLNGAPAGAIRPQFD
jgi:EAL domain-containing protein (putative c-di-GMP-specific phosphodiesterase class I)